MNQFYVCYPNGKFKALTFSYDDGRAADKRLVDIFNSNGLKGTFHLNGGLFPEKTQNDSATKVEKADVAKLYKGHEVAAHTYTHPTISRSPIDRVVQEIMADRDALEVLVHYPVRGFSYPNGSFTEEIKTLLPLLGIEYGRIVGNSQQFNLPSDWYEWQATCHHNHRLLELGKQFIAHKKSQYLYLMYVWGHSYEFDEENNWEIIEEFSELMGKQSDIWYTTNIQFKDYMEDARRLQYAVNGAFVYNPNAQSIWIRKNNRVIEVAGGTKVELE